MQNESSTPTTPTSSESVSSVGSVASSPASGSPVPAAGTASSEVVASPPKRSKRWVTPVLGVVAALAVGLVGGVAIGNADDATAADSSARGADFPGAPDGATGAGGGLGGNLTSGTVTAVDGDTITLESTDGSEVTVTTDGDTTVTTTEESSVGDLAAGDSLTVVGEADDDGNVAATTVTEGAAMGGFGGGAPGDAPADAPDAG